MAEEVWTFLVSHNYKWQKTVEVKESHTMALQEGLQYNVPQITGLNLLHM